MTGFPWFPIGHAIASGKVGRLRGEGPGYQVLQDQTSDALILILAADEPVGKDAAKISGASRFWAEQSPFDLKDVLKRRGYRWSDGSDGRPRSWYVDVCETALQDEIAFLRSEIYLSEIEPRLQILTAFTRFSARA